MPGIARSISNLGFGFCTLALVAVTTSSSVAANSDSARNATVLLERIEACVVDVRAKKHKWPFCDALGDSVLLDNLDPSVRERITAIKATKGVTEARLVGLANYLRSISLVEGAEAGTFDSDSLNKIMADYSFEQDDETISLSTRFWQWVAEKMRQSGIADRLDSIGESFSIDAEQRALIRKVVTWAMGGALVIALLFFFWTLWRYLDPNFRRRRVDLEKSRSKTGADRGNTPVMSLAQIRKLPANQQPAALLVACLDRLRGRELPEDVWKFTNSEIASTLTLENSQSIGPISRLIEIAELTIYGDRQASRDEVDGCFDAADTILDAGAEIR